MSTIEQNTIQAIQIKPENTKRPIRVLIIGTQGTGKTSLLAGLAVYGAPSFNAKLTVTAADHSSATYMNDLAKALYNGVFPNSTNRTELCKMNVCQGKLNIEFMFLDYPGEEMKSALLELDKENFEQIYKYMSQADYLFVLIDPAMIRNNNQETTDKVLALYNAIQETAKEHKLKASERKRGVDGGVILTKADTIEELETQSPKECFKNSWASLDEKLKIHFRNMEYFAVSATGPCMKIVTDGKEKLAPNPNALEPFGYQEIFDWIQKRERVKSIQKYVSAIVATVIIIIAGTAIWNGRLAYQRYLDIKTLENSTLAVSERLIRTARSRAPVVIQNRLQLVDNEIVRLEQEITIATNGDQLLKLEKDEIEILLKSQTDARKERINELLSQSRNKRESTLETRIDDTFADKDFKLCQQLATQFLHDFPKSSRSAKVRDILEEIQGRKMSENRALIKSMLVNSEAELRDKCVAISNFLKEYGANPKLTEEDLKGMRRAEELGNKFCERNTYEIELVKSGEFTSRTLHKVELILKDGSMLTEESDQAAQEFNWSSRIIRMEWATGDPIDVRFLADIGFVSGWSLVGKHKDSSPIALSIFNSRRYFNIEDSWKAYVNNAIAYVEFKVNGISEEDWKAVADYLSPGGTW